MSDLANKDEALKCLELSKQKHRNGDSSGAIKFARKSIKLFSTKQAQDWLIFLQNPSSEPSPNAPQQRKKPVVQEKPALPYTPEQTAGIKRILQMKQSGDLYGILGLEKGCSDNEVKKAYRRFALLYHPDKCGAPGTDDAFKAISHAWTVLGDSDKKENYDRYGVDSEASGNRAAPNPFQGFQGFGGQQGFDGQISPEELLRMFMGGGGGFQTGGFRFQTGPGFGGPRFRTQRNRREPEQEQAQGAAAVILQFLPVILLFVLSALSLFATEDDPFSFQRNYEYSLNKETGKHNVKYYVNPRTFSRRFGTTRKLAELEQRVENDYLNHIRSRCHQERETKQFYIRQANSWFSVNEEKLKKAQNMPTPFCDQLSTWYTK